MTAVSLTLMYGAKGQTRDGAADEEALIRRFLEDRDLTLFAELIRPYEARVHRLVAATLGPRLRLEVDDCVQDILVHVFRKLPGFGFRSRFQTWLYTVARTKALDVHRRPRHKRLHLDDEALTSVASPEEDPYAATIRSEEASRLHDAVERLPEPQRSVIHLFYWMDASVDDISELLGCKRATVKSHLFRARKRLGQRLGDKP